MNPNRSTEGDSPLRWLNVIQRGGTEDWKLLYRECRDPATARAVAVTLAWADPDLLPSARLWRFLLEDLHPDGLRDLRVTEAVYRPAASGKTETVP